MLSAGRCLHLPDRVQQIMGPHPWSAMSKRAGFAKVMFVCNGGTSSSDKFVRGMRRPQPYCLVVSEEPLRSLLQPRICNVILVPDEIRCSHAWPAGVNRSLMVEHVMPKRDSAASEHIEWSEEF